MKIIPGPDGAQSADFAPAAPKQGLQKWHVQNPLVSCSCRVQYRFMASRKKNLLLRKAFEKVESPLSKAENARHLAIANARLGNRDQADKYLKLARQLDSQCRLIERAEAELEHQINRL